MFSNIIHRTRVIDFSWDNELPDEEIEFSGTEDLLEVDFGSGKLLSIQINELRDHDDDRCEFKQTVKI